MAVARKSRGSRKSRSGRSGRHHGNAGVAQPDVREKYKAMTRHPGKFEGEAAYVPYFYEKFLDGLGEQRGDGTLFHVTAQDRDVFPELKGRRTIRIRESDDGFVYGS